MAKKISILFLALVLTVVAFVPMLSQPVSAATSTYAKRFDSSVSSDFGYKVINTYPTAEYVATYEVIFNGSKSDETYPNADPIFTFATPYVNLFAQPTKGLVGIKDGGFGGIPSPTVSASYTFEWGKYYRFDFVMMSNKATIRINGEDVLSYSKSMNYTSSDYIILCPAHIQMDFLSDRLYYLSGVCHHDCTGNANIVGTNYWTNSNDYNGATITAYDLEALNKCANMVETVDKVYWNNTTAMPQGMRIDTQTGDDNGYSNQTVNDNTQLTFDYMMEFDFVIQSFNGSKGNAQFGGGAQNFFIGYDFQYGAWSIIGGNPWSDLGDGYKYEVVTGRRYHWKLQVTTSGVKLWIDGMLIINNTSYKRVDSNYFIFYPRGCIADITNYDWFLNVGGTWQRWRHISYSQPTEPFTGAALCSSNQANGAGSLNGRSEHYSTSPVNFTLNSEGSISKANSYYSALSSADKGRIRTTALTQGTNAINAIKAINNIGTVAMNSTSKGKIDAAKTAYNNTDNAYKGKIVNSGTLTAAETQYNNLCQNAANTVITAINNIGTVSVNSGTAITNARTAYNNCSYADARAKITNYSTLTAAETEYNAIRPVYDNIAAIGTVTVDSGSAITTARNGYNALTSARQGKITNYSTLTAAETEYNAIRPVYDNIAAIGTVTVNSGSAITTARNGYNALTSARQGKITNYSTLTAAETEYNAIRPVYEAIAALPTVADTQLSHGTAITSAYNSYTALSSARQAKITNATTLTNVKAEYDTINGAQTKINALPATATAADGVTLSSASTISTARSAYDALSSTQKAKVTATRLTAAESEYATIRGAQDAFDALPATATAANGITLSSTGIISTAQTAYNNMTSTQRGKTDYSRLTEANTEYNAIKGVYDDIAAIGTVALSSEAAIATAEASYAALSTATRKGKITNYSTLTAARAEYNTLNTVNTEIIDLPAVADIAITDGAAITDAYNAYQNLSEEQKAKIPSETVAALVAAKAENDAIQPVYAAVEALDSTPSLAEGDADITAAETSYGALTPAQQAKVDAANAVTLDERRAAFDALKPTVSMSGTLNSAKIQSNLYFTIPTSQVNTAEQKAAFKINIAGTEYSLTDAAVTAQISGDKTHFILHVTSAAKDMSKSISYSITSTYNGGTTYRNSTTSVAAYATALLSYTDANADKQAKVRTAAQRMLEYGRTAEIYFNVNGDNSATISAAAPTATVVASATPFDNAALNAQLGKSVTVGYLAISVTCKSDTTLSIAFFVHTGYTKEAAKAWMKSNMTLDGSPVTVTESGNYLIVSKQNVPVTQIRTSYNFVVAGTTYKVSVLDYLVKAQAKAGNANLNALAKAMYAYALAAEALG